MLSLSREPGKDMHICGSVTHHRIHVTSIFGRFITFYLIIWILIQHKSWIAFLNDFCFCQITTVRIMDYKIYVLCFLKRMNVSLFTYLAFLHKITWLTCSDINSKREKEHGLCACTERSSSSFSDGDYRPYRRTKHALSHLYHNNQCRPCALQSISC